MYSFYRLLGLWISFYRPQRSCEGYVFTGMCLSTRRGVSVLSACWDITPPEQTPQEQTLPWSRHTPPRSRHPPWSRHPPEQTPPTTPLPRSRHPPEQTHTPLEQTPSWEQTPPPSGADTTRNRHPRKQTPPPRETATAADGTHPTGMHSCYNFNLQGNNTEALVLLRRLRKLFKWKVAIACLKADVIPDFHRAKYADFVTGKWNQSQIWILN